MGAESTITKGKFGDFIEDNPQAFIDLAVADVIRVAEGFKLDPEDKAAWRKDLLSGEYEQGFMSIACEAGTDERQSACCLGVKAVAQDLPVVTAFGDLGKRLSEILPGFWGEYNYIDSEAPKSLPMNVQLALSHLNDDGTTTTLEDDGERNTVKNVIDRVTTSLNFEQIAEVIERAL